MLSTEELFVYVYVLIDEAIKIGAIEIPPRPGPTPACSDGEVLTIAVVRHLLARRTEYGFLGEVRRDWSHLFPTLPHQSEFNRRVRWLWGAFEMLRQSLMADVPADDWGQIDTSALPVMHPSRVRGPNSWVGLNGLVGRFGRDGAHAEWFYGFRLVILTELGTRAVRAWGIVPAAVNEREVGRDLVDNENYLAGLLCDKGFNGKKFAEELKELGISLLIPPTKKQRKTMPKTLQKIIAEWRNRVETTFGEITDRMELARHGAHTFWGFLTRTASTIAAHTLLRTCLSETPAF